MKNIALIFLIVVAFTNCKSIESQQSSNTNLKTEINSTKPEITPASENLVKDLTEKQMEQLDRSLPLNIREILDKAEEIEVYASIDKDSKQLKVLYDKNPPNTVAKLSDASLKKQFLESFYYDAALGNGGFACWKPQQRVKANYGKGSVEFDICYQCSNFKGSGSNGNFSGSLAYESKSSLVIKEIIEKYGIILQ